MWQERIAIRHLSRPSFRLVVSLADAGNRTRLTWQQVFDTAEECRSVRGFATPASEENLDRLEAELARRA